ncbi:unnamed protein product [Closterium sp. NIES-65]|nr:unnamed protein product [Closterium sp. NIES-65]
MSGGPAGGMGGGGTSRDGAQMHPDMAFEWGYSPRAVHSPSRFSRDEEANPNRTKSNLSQQRTLSLSAARLSQAAADLGFHVTASANAPPAAQAGAFPGFSPAAAAAAAAALAAGGDAGGGGGLGGGVPGGGLVRGGSGLAGWSGGVAGAGGPGHLQSLTVDPSKAGISSRGAGGHGVPPLPLPSPKGNAAAAAAGKLGSPRGNFSGSRAGALGHWPRAGLPASIQQQLMLGAMGGGAGGGSAAGGGAAGLAGLGGMPGGYAGGGGGMGALGNVGGAGTAGMAGMGGMAGLAALNSSSDGSGNGGGSGNGIPGMSLQTQLSLLAAQLDGRLDDNNPLSRTSSAPPLGALLASIGDVAELERLYRLLPDAMSPDVSLHVGLTLPYQSIGYLSSTVPSMAALIRERTKLSRTSSCPPPVAEDMSGGAGGSGMEERAGEGESSESEGESGQRGTGAGHKRKKRRAPGGVGAGADVAGRSGVGGKVLALPSPPAPIRPPFPPRVPPTHRPTLPPHASARHPALQVQREPEGGLGRIVGGMETAHKAPRREPDDALDGGARLGGRGGGGVGGGGAGSGGRGSAGAWGGSPGGGYSMQGGGMGGSMQAGAMETSSQDYIHVRARRGQATDSHSLAERVRREKISDRMKVLQSLVPTCTKATGKAVMLDEIINYVRSLQLQVELLSAKLAAIEQDTAEMDGSDSPADFCAAQMAALGGLLLPSAPASAAAAGTGTGGGGNATAMGGGATAAGASAGAGASGGSGGSAGAAAVAAAALAGGSFRQASPSCSQSHDWSTTDSAHHSTASPMATPSASASASLGAAAALHPDMASLPTDLARLLLSRHLPNLPFAGAAGGAGGTGGGAAGGEEMRGDGGGGMGGGGGGMGGGGGGMGGGGGGMGGGAGEGLGELTMEQLQAQLDVMNGVGAGGGGGGGRGRGGGGPATHGCAVRLPRIAQLVPFLDPPPPHTGLEEPNGKLEVDAWDGGLESIVAAAAAMPPSQQAQSASGNSHSANNQPASGSPSLSQQSAGDSILSMESHQSMSDSLRAHLSALHGEARRRLPAALASAQVASVCFAAVLVLVLLPLGLWIGRLGMGVKMIYGFLAWVNAAVRQMWPELRKASTDMLKSSLRGLLEGYHFGIITGIDVRSVDLGPDPPTITGYQLGIITGIDVRSVDLGPDPPTITGYQLGIITGIDVRSVDLGPDPPTITGYHLGIITGIDVRSVDLGPDPPTITGYQLGIITGIDVRSVDLGPDPPTITAVRVHRGGPDNGQAQRDKQRSRAAQEEGSAQGGGEGGGGKGEAGVVTVAEAKEQAERRIRGGAEAQVLGKGQGEGMGQREEQGQGEGEGQGKGEGEGEGVWEEKRGRAEAKEQGQGGEGEGEGEGGGGAEGGVAEEGVAEEGVAEEGVAEEGVADEVIAEVVVEWVEGRVQQRSMRLRVQTAMSPDVDVQVSSIAAAATLKLTLKPLLPRLPGFGAVLLSLLNQPFFDFKVSVMGGNLKAMPGFEKMIETVLRLSIDDSLVWPSRWVYPVVEGDFSFLELIPVGYLDVSQIEAEGLPKTNVLTRAADPILLQTSPSFSPASPALCSLHQHLQFPGAHPNGYLDVSLIEAEDLPKTDVLTGLHALPASHTHPLGSPSSPLLSSPPLLLSFPRPHPSGFPGAHTSGVARRVADRGGGAFEDGCADQCCSLICLGAASFMPACPPSSSFLELTPVGYLDVSLIEAEGLPKTDVLTGAADPFVLLYVRQREGAIKRSSTVHHSRHPTWNEGFILEVEDPDSQQLTIRLMDSERFEKSEFIGAHMLLLHTLPFLSPTLPFPSQLHPNKAQDLWLDLYDKPETHESASTHGRVHVVVMFVPYTQREGGGESAAEGKEGEVSAVGEERRSEVEAEQKRPDSIGDGGRAGG